MGDSLLPVRPPTPLPRHLGGTAGKNRPRITRYSAQVLKDWFQAHVENPYPSPEDFFDLVCQSGLTITQVKTWFANKRRRTKAKTPRHSASKRRDRDADDGVANLITMLNRWESSPPEDDPVDMNAVIRASASWKPIVSDCSLPTMSSLDSDDSDMSLFRTSSDANSSASQSSDGHSSHHSRNSSREFGEGTGGTHGRRRRRRRNGKIALSRSKDLPQARRFQCTFCTSVFSTKYDWARHEKSIHLSLETWICSLHSIPLTDTTSANDSIKCTFCRSDDPTAAHIITHEFETCLKEKDLSVRTFTRKDHLSQHLRLVHKSTLHPFMEAWLMDLSDTVKSTCGFCLLRLSTWAQRVEHLALHYREGLGIESWVGGWGFEPHIEARVENAIWPYLIHSERKAMDYSLKDRSMVGTSTGDQAYGQWLDDLDYLPHNQHSELFYISDGDEMESRLAAQIRNIIDSGLPFPSHAEVQTFARLLVFGDPDPWNSTLAENSHWIAAFKLRHGFSYPPCEETDPVSTQ